MAGDEGTGTSVLHTLPLSAALDSGASAAATVVPRTIIGRIQSVSVFGEAGPVVPYNWDIAFEYDWAQDYINTFNPMVCNCSNPLLEVPIDLDIFRNCSIGAEYVLSFLGYKAKDPNTGPALSLTLAFWREALLQPWRDNATDAQVHEHLLHTPYFAFGFPTIAPRDGESFYYSLFQPLYEGCWREVCKGVGFSGNPDITGVGMMTTYYFMAICTTLYFIHFGRRLLRGNLHSSPPSIGSEASQTWPQRHRKAMQESVQSSLSGSILFSYVVAISTTIQTSTNSLLYDSLVAVVLTLFSLNPTICLLMLAYPDWGNLKFIGIIYNFYMVIWISMWISMWISWDSARWWHLFPDSWCYNEYILGFQPNKIALFLLVGYLPLLWLGITNLFPWLIGRGALARNRSENDRTITRWIRAWTAFYSLALTWIDLGFLTAMRRAEKNISGPTYQESTWGFGQVSAVLGCFGLVVQYLITFFNLSRGRETGMLQEQELSPTIEAQQLPEETPQQLASPAAIASVINRLPDTTGQNIIRSRT